MSDLGWLIAGLAAWFVILPWWFYEMFSKAGRARRRAWSTAVRRADIEVLTDPRMASTLSFKVARLRQARDGAVVDVVRVMRLEQLAMWLAARLDRR